MTRRKSRRKVDAGIPKQQSGAQRTPGNATLYQPCTIRNTSMRAGSRGSPDSGNLDPKNRDLRRQSQLGVPIADQHILTSPVTDKPSYSDAISSQSPTAKSVFPWSQFSTVFATVDLEESLIVQSCPEGEALMHDAKPLDSGFVTADLQLDQTHNVSQLTSLGHPVRRNERCLRITLDPDGDTAIILAQRNGHTGSDYALASSKLMTLASPVWKQMLEKARPMNDYEQSIQLSMQDEPREALIVLLNIVHLQFDNVPFDIPLNVLTSFAVLCHKYQCSHLARPFKDSWISRHDVPGSDGDARKAKLLLISWIFGCSVMFARLARDDILDIIEGSNPLHLKRNLMARLTDGGGFSWSSMPTKAIDTIYSVQQNTITSILQIIITAYQDLRAKACCQNPLEGVTLALGIDRCNNEMLKHFARLCYSWKPRVHCNFAREPYINAEGISVFELIEFIEDLPRKIQCTPGHARCNIGRRIADEVRAIANNITSDLRARHKSWVEKLRRSSQACRISVVPELTAARLSECALVGGIISHKNDQSMPGEKGVA